MPRNRQDAFRCAKYYHAEFTDNSRATTVCVDERIKVETVIENYLGDSEQIPPMVSAIKKNGVPLYKMARKGKTVEREPRFIRISELKLTQWDSPKGGFFMSCSKGTYVRTVLHDLGQNLNCGAHMSSLRRTQIDQFSIDQAKPLQDIQDMTLGDIQNRLIPIREAVPSHVL